MTNEIHKMIEEEFTLIKEMHKDNEQFAKQTNEITDNTMRTVGINNQLAINAIDAARENLRIYNRTVDAITDFSSNAAKAWISLFSRQQFFNR
jgi:hypothetical protein